MRIGTTSQIDVRITNELPGDDSNSNQNNHLEEFTVLNIIGVRWIIIERTQRFGSMVDACISLFKRVGFEFSSYQKYKKG